MSGEDLKQEQQQKQESQPVAIRKATGSNDLVVSKDPNHPANLICELCKLFYDQNWVTGTGGGMSIRDGYVLSIYEETPI